MKIKKIIVAASNKKLSICIATPLIERLKIDNLYREYAFLKILHKMGLPVSFDQMAGITYRFLTGNRSLVVNQKDMELYKLINVEHMVREYGIGPGTFSEFLDVNGAKEVDAKGKPILDEHKKAFPHGVTKFNPNGKAIKYVREPGPLGFWKRVTASMMVTFAHSEVPEFMLQKLRSCRTRSDLVELHKEVLWKLKDGAYGPEKRTLEQFRDEIKSALNCRVPDNWNVWQQARA